MRYMKKPNRVNQRKIDLLLALILLVCICLFLIAAMMLQVIPSLYMWIIAIVLLAVFAGVFVPILLRSRNYRWVRRAVCLAMSAVLVVGSGYMFLVNMGLSGFGEQGNTALVGVVVPSDSETEDANELKMVGVSSYSNDIISEAMKEYETYNFEVSEYNSISGMLTLLDENQLDGVIMSKSDFDLKNEQDSTFADRYKMISPVKVQLATQEAVQKDLTNTPFTVFVSGMEILEAPDVNGLSDVNMLLMVDPIKHHVEMISIPRDAYVPNSLYDNYPDKLTHLGYNGLYDMMDTLESIFDIEIDYYARVSFSSLIEIVDALGGITVDVQLEFEEQDENRSFASNDMIHLYPGVQELDGREALAYARHRKTEWWGDAGRNLAQRQIIEAIAKKILTVDGIAKIPEVLSVAQEYVSTNVPMDQVRNFVRSQVETLPNWTFNSLELNHWVAGSAEKVASDNENLLWVCYLSEIDIANVHSYYLEMTQGSSLNDFAFDLNDMTLHLPKPDTADYVVTAENYDEVMSQYFPDIYRG